jgi:hypothetical protein
MKTLKQLLREKATYYCGCYILTDNEVIEIVKKWLTQKPTKTGQEIKREYNIFSKKKWLRLDESLDLEELK